jgi:hypothetical protein
VSRRTVHKYKNIGDEVGKLMVIGIPAGLEDFFKELGVPVTDEKNFTLLPYPYEIDRIIEISKKHGVTYVPTLNRQSQ